MRDGYIISVSITQELAIPQFCTKPSQYIQNNHPRSHNLNLWWTTSQRLWQHMGSADFNDFKWVWSVTCMSCMSSFTYWGPLAWNPFHKGIMSSWLKYFENFPFVIIMILRMQSGHKFAHVMTAQLSWHVQNCDLIGSLLFKYEQNYFFQHINPW